MFAIFNYAIIFYSFFVLRETAGKSLEEMEVVFGTVDRLPTKGDEEDAQEGSSVPREVYSHDNGKATDARGERA